MAQIEFKKQKAILGHISFASNSKENDDKTIPVSIKFEVSEHNSWLSNFHSRLATSLYMVDDTEQPLPGTEGERSKRVFGDLLDSFKLKTQLDGAGGTIYHGIKETELPIELATVKGFVVTLLEGGTVKVSFNVQARFTSKQIATLSELLETEVFLSLGMLQGELDTGEE